MNKQRVLSGLDQLPKYDHLLRGRRIGLMTNHTGINLNFESAIDVISRNYNLTALFACEHGIRGTVQAGEHVDTTVDERTGVPVFSCYGDHTRLTAEMLDTFDLFVFDMQDVGARFYTYLYSLSYAMEECARHGKSVLVLDRINPIGGAKVEGTVLDERFHSFVGEYALPTRYGLTIGEYALWVKRHLDLDLDLTVAPLKGWYREFLLPDCAVPWVAPSPNINCFESALCYIGTCVFEGTNLSEGRGTPLPFQIVGAPWVNGAELAKRMNAKKIQGVHYRECSFSPNMSKHAGQMCQGVQLHITDAEQFDSFAAGLFLLDEIRALHGDKFEFLTGTVLNSQSHLDRLLGTDAYRVGGKDASQIIKLHAYDIDTFKKERQQYFLYRL
ncbi:MAG: DUF1343 domain-containing protein [Clostridiales bacterium]|nr:DUF1343 domain-containing protein [Clostridiales bacterium]